MTDKTPQLAIYDALIIGGGPAGLAAAIYLGRALRTSLVIDSAVPGRSNWGQSNHNYLGFPDGLPIRELVCRGKQQAEQYGAAFVQRRVTSIERESHEHFTVRADNQTYHGRTVLIATGVTDQWVEFPGSESLIGHSLHWCIVCDGYEMQGQRVLVVGNGETAVEDALQLRRFTRDVALLVEPDGHSVTANHLEELQQVGIAVHYGRIARATNSGRGTCTGILTDRGEELAVDHIFSLFGSTPNIECAKDLNLDLNKDGFITVDTEARTSCPGVFAAGDVTRLFSHQVITAAHEGATAAMSIAVDLWRQEDR